MRWFLFLILLCSCCVCGCSLMPAMKTDIDRIIGVNKEIQQHNYEHQEAHRDAIATQIQTAGVKDSTVIALAACTLGAIVLGVRRLMKHEEMMRQHCKYIDVERRLREGKHQ